MKIQKGTKLLIKHTRKGTFMAIAASSFDTDDEWYNVKVADGEDSILGLSAHKYWEAGEDIPCRASLCKIEVIK